MSLFLTQVFTDDYFFTYIYKGLLYVNKIAHILKMLIYFTKNIRIWNSNAPNMPRNAYIYFLVFRCVRNAIAKVPIDFDFFDSMSVCPYAFYSETSTGPICTKFNTRYLLKILSRNFHFHQIFSIRKWWKQPVKVKMSP